jgi:WhiB family redox-sensing transcriptional regulator
MDYKPSSESSWRKDAACAPLDGYAAPDMYPHGEDYDAIEYAQSFCQVCPVRNGCLEEALANNEQHGIWGGLTTRERNGLVRRRQRIAKLDGTPAVRLDAAIPHIDVSEALDAASESLGGVA